MPIETCYGVNVDTWYKLDTIIREDPENTHEIVLNFIQSFDILLTVIGNIMNSLLIEEDQFESYSGFIRAHDEAVKNGLSEVYNEFEERVDKDDPKMRELSYVIVHSGITTEMIAFAEYVDNTENKGNVRKHLGVAKTILGSVKDFIKTFTQKSWIGLIFKVIDEVISIVKESKEKKKS